MTTNNISPNENSVSEQAPLLGPFELLMLGLWFGAVVGLGELASVVGPKWITGRIVSETLGTNWHFAWMVPVSNLVLFGSLATLIAIAASFFPRWPMYRIAMNAFVFMTVMMIALSVPGLHLYARLLISAGIAYQIAYRFVNRPKQVRRVLMRSIPILLIAVLGLTVWQISVVCNAEQRKLAALPAPAQDAPNVLLIVLDTVRADAITPYGAARNTTPNLAKLAAKGIRFDQARSTAPWTLPSHASMFTGRLAHELGVGVGQPLDRRYPTVAEVLSAQGYVTGGFVANTMNTNAWFGLDRGFAHYEDLYENTRISFIEVLRASKIGKDLLLSKWGNRIIGSFITSPKYVYRKDGSMINRDALNWLDGHSDRPFFVFLNYFDAHGPYVPPTGAKRPFSTRPDGTLSPEPRDSYDDCLSYLDEQVGRLMTELEARGKLENTIIIVTADHGETFGEHGVQGHGVSLYRPELHVPLFVIYPPKVSAGLVVNEPISIRDIPETIVQLADSKVSTPFPGKSLASQVVTSPRHEPVLAELKPVFKVQNTQPNAPSNRGKMRSIVTRDWVFILNGDGVEELYDLRRDSEEKHNLINEPNHLETAKRLSRALQDSLKPNDRPEIEQGELVAEDVLLRR